MKIGLTLSGGAAYGLANVGIVEVLHQQGIHPSCISGSSMGAIVGALYALHGNTDAFEPLLNDLHPWSIARVSEEPLKDGLHGGLFRQKLQDHLQDILGDATIADCTIPFVCVAAKVSEPIDWKRIVLPTFTDEVLQSTSLHVFPPRTRLIDALMATSAIPVLFSPVTIDGDTFVDLVHFGSVPARTLKDMHHPDVVIGTDTTPRYEQLMKVLPTGWAEFLRRGYDELDRSLASCDLVIRPELDGSPLRFDKASAFVEAGKKAASAQADDLHRLTATYSRTGLMDDDTSSVRKVY